MKLRSVAIVGIVCAALVCGACNSNPVAITREMPGFGAMKPIGGASGIGPWCLDEKNFRDEYLILPGTDSWWIKLHAPGGRTIVAMYDTGTGSNRMSDLESRAIWRDEALVSAWDMPDGQVIYIITGWKSAGKR